MAEAGWREYRKAVLTRARQAREAGTIDTLEGPAAYAPGDYICGPRRDGEQWPQTRERFEKSFDLISGPDRYGMFSYRKRGTVSARRQPDVFSAELADGTVLSGKAGDWLVRDASGSWVVDAAVFAESYVPA